MKDQTPARWGLSADVSQSRAICSAYAWGALVFRQLYAGIDDVEMDAVQRMIQYRAAEDGKATAEFRAIDADLAGAASAAGDQMMT